MAVLQVLKGLNPGQLFPLEGELLVLGRHPDCDIVLDVGAVSRQHAQIVVVGGEYFVEDLKSRNGTFVNGRVIQGRQRLLENDRLKICDLLFTFHDQIPDRSGSRGLSPSRAMLVDDEEPSSGGSTVMSKLDVQSSHMMFRVNPEAKLSALLEISKNLGSTIGLEQVLNKVLDSLFKIFLQADRGFVVLVDPETQQLVPKAVKHRRPEEEEVVRISRTIVQQVMSRKEAILSADAASDSRFDTSQSIVNFRIRSMMCAPLVDSQGTALGIIQIDSLNPRNRFSKDDLDVLGAVAVQSAFALENAQLHEQTLNRQALERDLRTAHRVQQSFLPSHPPMVRGYQFFNFYEPANIIGGDFFDYVDLSGGRIAVIVADVSGKGIPAALLMAKLSADARYCLASAPTPAEAMRRLNTSFLRNGVEDRFVTMIMCVVDPVRHEVTVVNAGHMAPLLRRTQGDAEALADDLAGLPLGVDADYPYEQFSYTLQECESLTLFTDGFSEAMNENSDLYGVQRLQTLLSGPASCVADIGPAILADVKKFVGERSQSDDMCLLLFGREATVMDPMSLDDDPEVVESV